MGTTTMTPSTRRRRTKPPEIPGRATSYRLGRARVLEAGDEAEVRFPGRVNRKRAKFMYATNDTLVFVSPFNGGLVGVAPEAVGTIHRDTKLRGAK
jgi:hypothetical protein